MVVRCPYCVDVDHFKKMNVRDNGVYVCTKCRHIAVPENDRFRCWCDHCAALDAFNAHKARTWLASAARSAPTT